jgi:hypothetical protein
MTAVKTEISRKHTNAAIREVVDRHIAEGRVSRLTAQTIEAAALPIIAPAIKKMRQNGYSAAEVTQYLAEKVAEAEAPARKLAAEIYAAAWAGMQADFREMYGRDL